MHQKISRENWDQQKAQVRERWPELTDSDLSQVGGDRQKLIERLERAGCSRQDAEEQVRAFESAGHDSKATNPVAIG
jgi:uncharacterized protein YjbJ (UPF0337 family)